VDSNPLPFIFVVGDGYAVTIGELNDELRPSYDWEETKQRAENQNELGRALAHSFFPSRATLFT
jgi:hypothetical protein